MKVTRMVKIIQWRAL